MDINLNIPQPPRTMMEVFKMLPEGTLAELIDNKIFMSPSPLSNHQIVSIDLATEMYTFLKSSKSGQLFTAPFDVYLDETSNAVQPDIIVVLKNRLEIIQPKGHIHGVPNLLIEILSSGNKDYDLVIKKNLYENFGVEEYIIVDPETKHTETYVLENGTYQSFATEVALVNSKILNRTFEF